MESKKDHDRGEEKNCPIVFLLFTVTLYIMRIYIMFNSLRVVRLFNVF